MAEEADRWFRPAEKSLGFQQHFPDLSEIRMYAKYSLTRLLLR